MRMSFGGHVSTAVIALQTQAFVSDREILLGYREKLPDIRCERDRCRQLCTIAVRRRSREHETPVASPGAAPAVGNNVYINASFPSHSTPAITALKNVLRFGPQGHFHSIVFPCNKYFKKIQIKYLPYNWKLRMSKFSGDGKY